MKAELRNGNFQIDTTDDGSDDGSDDDDGDADDVDSRWGLKAYPRCSNRGARRRT